MFHDLAAKHDVQAVVDDLLPVVAVGQYQIDIFSWLHINSEIIPTIGNYHGPVRRRSSSNSAAPNVQDIQSRAGVWSDRFL
jgi:hypothetical protein